jgi:anaerobic selenocysteine-containing dehydrogenase
MSRIGDALVDGTVRVLMLAGTDMMSSFADAGRVAEGLGRLDLLVSFDLFMNDTARRFAHIVLPATAWVEELGAKATNTHVYLMPKIVEPAGECRSPMWMLRELARRLELDDFFPWDDDAGPLDAILDHPRAKHATVAELTREGGMRALEMSHVGHPDLKFSTPSGKVEFASARAAALGLPALPTYEPLPASSFPLQFRQGRTLTHFHGFYDHGRALPSLAAADPEPVLWIAPDDATARGIDDRAPIRIWNERGEMLARAHVTGRIRPGTVWMRDGWADLNVLTSGAPVLPDAATDIFGFSAGQATFDAAVDVAPVVAEVSNA